METEEATAEPVAEVNPVDANENSNESFDLNFAVEDNNEGENDELENEQEEEESDSDSDSDFSSPLSPLLRFGLGGRRYRYGNDSDSDSTEYDEEVREKANKITNEIIGKTHPASLHEQFSWPRVFLNRQRGYFCKKSEARYMNHRKVFERNFYGSLNAIERLELMAKLDEHLGCVNCLGFSKNGLYLLSGSDDLRVVLWRWHNQKVVKSVSSKHKKNIFQTKFYEETSTAMKAISASADGTISLHNFTNDGGHTEKQIYTHAGAVHKVAVTDNTILSCAEDGLIIEYDFRTKSPQKLITVREKHRKVPLFSITAHPFECKYAISGRDKYVRVFDRRNEKTVLSRHCPNDLLSNASLRYISCCVYNYNGSELLASFNDENIYLFDANDHRLGSYMHKYTGHINSATIKGVNFFGPKSEYIVTG
jgi:DDB1- and CUL4-associated factor 8